MTILDKITVFAAMTMVASLAAASELLRIGIPDSSRPPIAAISGKQLTGGLLYTIGESLANKLGAQAEFIIIPIKRIERLLNTKTIHIVCNLNPEWLKEPDKVSWTKEIYHVTGRVVSLSSLSTISQIDDLTDKRISTLLGYKYPKLEYLWENHKASRHDENKIDHMLKAVEKDLADVAIVYDIEFDTWAKDHPKQANLFKMHPVVLGSKPTMCAVGRHSPFTVKQLDTAIEAVFSQVSENSTSIMDIAQHSKEKYARKCYLNPRELL